MTRPDQIPEHVMDAAWDAYVSDDPVPSSFMRKTIAAALDALMDDERVFVPSYGSASCEPVRPSDVLAAVLAREPRS
jgi:hypothetical protein